MNEESRTSLVRFIAHLSLLDGEIRRQMPSEQIDARRRQVDIDAEALAEILSKEDRETAAALLEAWKNPARVIARGAAEIKRQ